MAAYKDIIGQKITKVTSNPSEPKTGQMWYNSTTGNLKGLGILEAWSSAASMSTARVYAGSNGTQAAALIYGNYPNTVNGALTEEYNGSGFSTGGNLNTPRRSMGGAGTQTAGLAIAGYDGTNTNATEEYNGSSWTSVNNYSASDHNVCGFGTQTAAVGNGGSPAKTNAYNYDGTNWTATGSLNTGRSHAEGAGTQTAGLTFTGNPGFSGGYNQTESFDGSSWTTLATVNTGRADAMGGGSQTVAIVFGGRTSAPTATQATETWDGTSWTTSPATMSNTSSNGAGCANQPGSGTANISMGGGDAPAATEVATAEEYNKSTNTITAAAWASGTALPASKFNMASEGTATAGIVCGGELGPGTRTGETLYYDGTSWSDQSSAVSPAPDADNVQMEGTQTAAVLTSFRGGGAGSSDPAYYDAREWDGSSWTSIPSLSTQHTSAGMFRGNSAPTTATVFGGNNESPPSRPTATEEYNGSSWTAGGAMPTGIGSARGFGTPTTGVTTGGTTAPGGTNRTANAIEYDGSTWTSANSMVKGLSNHGAVGTNSSGFVYAGYNTTPAGDTGSQAWDGTSFSTQPNLSTGRGGIGSGGTGSGAAAWAAGGNPPVSTTVEEFTPETTAANVTNFSTE